MNDVRLEGAGGTPQPNGGATAGKGKSAAPVAAGALAIVAALVGGTMIVANGNDEPAVEPLAVTAEAPPPATGVNPPSPSSVPSVAFDQTPATGVQGGIEIVVKFKDDAKVKDIVDTFWKDQAAARSKFESFKAGKPAFAGLRLDRVTYSNELVLVDSSGGAPASRIAAMREIAAKLKGNPDVSYADPNMTAHPGGQ